MLLFFVAGHICLCFFCFQATTLAFIAQYGLPLSSTPHIINLAKTLSLDTKALSEVRLDRTTATYKLKYGLAASFHEKLLDKLRKYPFSLNLDEATSSSNKKVLTVLVSYFDVCDGCVKIEHLKSVELEKATSEVIFGEIVKLMEDCQIPWKNLTSVLMDSCSVMRGNKTGVETRLRSEKAPHLLDIDGDLCHHIHNASKKLCAPFEFYLERLFNDIFADFQYCTEYAGHLMNICEIIGISYSKPARFIPHRWLSAYDLAQNTKILFDAYLIFYYSFLEGDDRSIYKEEMDRIMKEIKSSDKTKLKQIQAAISNKKMTEDGKVRKKRIVQKLFFTEQSTKLQLSFYGEVLQLLKEYVCVFQSSETLVHQLHEK